MHLYRDSSIAPLLDLKRKVFVWCVLEDVILGGFNCGHSLELFGQ